jgi:hypothetical protein
MWSWDSQLVPDSIVFHGHDPVRDCRLAVLIKMDVFHEYGEAVPRGGFRNLA